MITSNNNEYPFKVTNFAPHREIDCFNCVRDDTLGYIFCNINIKTYGVETNVPLSYLVNSSNPEDYFSYLGRDLEPTQLQIDVFNYWKNSK